MTQVRDEDRLREGFQRLRSETEGPGGVPDFQAMMATAKAEAAAPPELKVESGGASDAPEHVRRKVLLIGGWASAAMAAAVAGLMLFGGQPDADAEFERLVAAYSAEVASGALSSRTASLLDVPGMGLTRSVPTFGGAARGLDRDGRAPAPDGDGRDS